MKSGSEGGGGVKPPPSPSPQAPRPPQPLQQNSGHGSGTGGYLPASSAAGVGGVAPPRPTPPTPASCTALRRTLTEPLDASDAEIERLVALLGPYLASPSLSVRQSALSIINVFKAKNLESKDATKSEKVRLCPSPRLHAGPSGGF